MRLYSNNQGGWAGTQSDARKQLGKGFIEYDVPTSKQDLLNFLNKNRVGGEYGIANREVGNTIVNVDPHIFNTDTPSSQTPKYHHAWTTIKECAEKASLKDLGVALGVLMNRLDEVADKQKEE